MTLKTVSWILLLQFLFGLNYLVSKTIVSFYPPLFWATLRSTFTAVIIMALLVIKKELQWQKFWANKNKFFWLAMAGIIINQGCFLLGLKLTTSYNSALINTLIPLSTLGIARLRGHEPMTRRQLFAFLISLIGVLILTPLKNFSPSNQTLLGDFLTLFNVLAYSSYLVLNREFLKNHTALWTTGWVFSLGSIGLAAITFLQIGFQELALPPPEIGKALIYGLIGGTLIPYLILAYALQKTSSANVALFVYLQPAIVGGLAAFFYDYRLSQESITATFLIFGGVFLATWKPPSKWARSKVDRLPQE